MYRELVSKLKKMLPSRWHRPARDAIRGFRRRLRSVPWENMRRLTPIARDFGYFRGQPVDRYYIARFLDSHRDDIRGRVLEIAESTYTRQYGGAAVTQSDVLHAVEGNPEATVVGNLVSGEGIPLSTYDCIIMTETLPFLSDVHASLRTIYRALTPKGILLATCGGISQISTYDMLRWGDYQRFTSLSLRRMLDEVFPPDRVTIEARGNVLAAVALLHGIVVEDLNTAELEHRDPEYEVTLTVRAEKPQACQ
jgi:hypothetical protein